MKLFTLQKQRGAVLAFSLVMLLLLTLVSISMIRQNKAQINIASNTGQQVKAFATVETALLQVQGILQPLRYRDDVGAGHCRPSTGSNAINEDDLLNTSALTGITARVVGLYCISNYSDPDGNGPLRATGDEARCFYKADGSRDSKLVTDQTASQSQLACGRLDHAGGWVAGQVWTPTNPNPRCQIEVYTLNVTMEDAVTQAKRTVESKFEIDCSNDFN
ncbi:MAG: hypothetical protein HOP02_11690 [Methylococcaceae bacterium]|nr:hypothetical protein [Methylococcaceae bacterium]